MNTRYSLWPISIKQEVVEMHEKSALDFQARAQVIAEEGVAMSW